MAELRTGYTTGTCAAAAAKAAIRALCGEGACDEVEVVLPDGTTAGLEVLSVNVNGAEATASVVKDAGDDPDITDKATVSAAVSFIDGGEIVFVAGDGIGTVTKPGLQVAVGEPAINPVPRAMIKDVIRSVTDKGVKVVISIPGGKELAEKTFNPRLGVVGGLSIIGTSGKVRPFSNEALRDALSCSLDVAAACGIRQPVFVPGHIGQKAAEKNFKLKAQQVVEVSNEWGYMLDRFGEHGFEGLLVLGHPGKLAKLAAGQWDTHSSRSDSALPVIMAAAEKLNIKVSDAVTAEGVFEGLAEEDSKKLADTLASDVRSAVGERIKNGCEIAVVLVNMAGDVLGMAGEVDKWQ